MEASLGHFEGREKFRTSFLGTKDGGTNWYWVKGLHVGETRGLYVREVRFEIVSIVRRISAAEAELLNLEDKEDLGREADKPKGVLDV